MDRLIGADGSLLTHATVVVDRFHLVKLGNDAVTKVRQRVTWDLRERRGRQIDPEWANRRRLPQARDRVSSRSFAKMWNGFIAADTGQILSAWIAKEELLTPAVHRARRWRCPADPASPAPVPILVHRFADDL
jgi:hypothetical protein